MGIRRNGAVCLEMCGVGLSYYIEVFLEIPHDTNSFWNFQKWGDYPKWGVGVLLLK